MVFLFQYSIRERLDFLLCLLIGIASKLSRNEEKAKESSEIHLTRLHVYCWLWYLHRMSGHFIRYMHDITYYLQMEIRKRIIDPIYVNTHKLQICVSHKRWQRWKRMGKYGNSQANQFSWLNIVMGCPTIKIIWKSCQQKYRIYRPMEDKRRCSVVTQTQIALF